MPSRNPDTQGGNSLIMAPTSISHALRFPTCGVKFHISTRTEVSYLLLLLISGEPEAIY
jgi:hypothetical protein